MLTLNVQIRTFCTSSFSIWLFYTFRGPSEITSLSERQCCGSVTYLFGSGSGSGSPTLLKGNLQSCSFTRVVPKCSYVNVMTNWNCFLFIYVLFLKSRSGRVKMLSKIKVTESLSLFRLTQSAYFIKLQKTSCSGRKNHLLALSTFICSLLLLLAVCGELYYSALDQIGSGFMLGELSWPENRENVEIR